MTLKNNYLRNVSRNIQGKFQNHRSTSFIYEESPVCVERSIEKNCKKMEGCEQSGKCGGLITLKAQIVLVSLFIEFMIYHLGKGKGYQKIELPDRWHY